MSPNLFSYTFTHFPLIGLKHGGGKLYISVMTLM